MGFERFCPANYGRTYSTPLQFDRIAVRKNSRFGGSRSKNIRSICLKLPGKSQRVTAKSVHSTGLSSSRPTALCFQFCFVDLASLPAYPRRFSPNFATMHLPSKFLEAGVNAFASLPGVGRKSALRHALHLLQQPTEITEEFLQTIATMREHVKPCPRCHNLSDGDLCEVCANPSRNQRLICVVENVRQVMAIEETGNFRGVYHVLGGVISPIEGIGPNDLNIESLIERVNQFDVDSGAEVIFAISSTIEGETTSFFIGRQLQDLPVKVSAIARGVSFGNDLEYADELTLSRSINARLPYIMQEG